MRLRPAARIVALALLPLAAPAALSSAAAQTGPAPMPVSLEEAVQRALDLSEEVQVARVRRGLAESQVTQARAGALPQVTASVLYTHTFASIFDDITFTPPGNGNGFEALPFGRTHAWTTTFQVMQPLYAGGAVSAGLDVARNVRRAADLEVEEAEAEITLQVRTAYFQLALADDLIAIASEAYRLAGAHTGQVELFRAQGTASDFDVLRARVERDNLEPPIIEARNARRLAELNLKRLINVPGDQPVVATTPLDLLLADIDRGALRQALERRTALLALDEVVAAREGAVRIAEAARRPTVALAGTFSFQAFPQHGLPFGADWRRDWTLGVQVSLPLFDGGRIRGQIDQALAELEEAELQRAQVRELLELEFETALGEFDAARAHIAARRATVAQARRALELAELRFTAGMATPLEISDARLLLQQAQVNEAQSLSAYITALAELERASNGEVPLVEPRLARVN